MQSTVCKMGVRGGEGGNRWRVKELDGARS